MREGAQTNLPPPDLPRAFRWGLEGVLAGASLPGAEDIRLYAEMGFGGIVSLEPISPEAAREIARLGLMHLCLYVDDECIPSRSQLREFFEFLDKMRAQLKPVILHCEYGWGRTGTLLALALVREGHGWDEDLVQNLGMETQGQFDLVRRFGCSPDTFLQEEMPEY